MKQKYIYRCLSIDNNDQKIWRIIEAYSDKQAELLIKKRYGWHVKIHHTEVVSMAPQKFKQLSLF